MVKQIINNLRIFVQKSSLSTSSITQTLSTGPWSRPDLKSDIWTIMDPVRLDLRNKFYLARNYRKGGGPY